jgi:Icc protein
MSNSDHKIVAMTRLLHFTDMHLRQRQPGTAGDPARLSRLMPAALDRLADRIKALAPDVVVMTGDVLDVPNEVIIGRTPDDRPLQSWIDDAVDDLVLVKDWFDGTGVAYMVMPGNHDHEAAFSRVFGDTSGARDIAGIRFFCFWDALASDRQPRRSGSRQELFRSALTAAEHDCPQIHVQHYMIDPPTFSRGWRYEYKDSAAMKSGIEASGRVRAVLSGHYHPGSLVTGAGGIVHSVAPAFCEAPHPFRVYDFPVDGPITVAEHALDD